MKTIAPKPETEQSSSDLLPITETLPHEILLLPVSQTTLFPGMLVPFILPEGRLTQTIEEAERESGYVGVVLMKEGLDAPIATGPTTTVSGIPAEGTIPKFKPPTEGSITETFYRFGVVAKIVKKINLPDNQISVLLTGMQRFRILDCVHRDPYYVAQVDYIHDIVQRNNELEALLRTALAQFKQISKENPLISEEIKVALVNIDGPGKLADFIASVLVRDVKDYQDLLATSDVKERFQRLLYLLKKELDVQKVQKRMQDEINQKVSSSQREFYLQEQLKFIQRELGKESEDKNRWVQKFKDRLKGKKLSETAQTHFQEEIEKIQTLSEHSSEYAVSLNYLDWLTILPWGQRTDENFDLKESKNVLDKDHYGLKDVKDRILEYLAIRKLKVQGDKNASINEGSILCLVGPPGVGKTSLGKSIAEALNRKFFRFSVGGMRDESEIKGHRRTYVGSMPGKMIQGLKRVGAQNPVFLIDEIDKLGTNIGMGGDPSSALLELLDPEQNKEFLDHYLDVPFDCSEVFFIATANSIDTIPHALLDRMEVIHLHGYTDNEKMHIAKKYLIPKIKAKAGLKTKQFTLSDNVLKHIIERYARESGVRNLEKQISKMARKAAFKIVTNLKRKVEVTQTKDVYGFLGLEPFQPEELLKEIPSGVATGLAWTAYGGEILFVESSAVKGKGGFTLTGQLGEVMQESANIAYTYVKEHSKEFKIPDNYFDKHHLHIHVPQGATPKDGPSAGVTMAASLVSLVSHKTLKPKIAMTGEITLKGRILPVGGIKEKILAAKRSQIKNIILPKMNEKDLDEVDDEIKKGMNFIKVSKLDDFLKHIF